ncbi:MAG: TetR/AcrR family transcriptional regulator [bacterium]|nr:TetR/AcrR family transcriptional regulator [bacterium]
MPKVTEEYIEEKKNFIMDIAMELMKKIPLYQITMRDFIKRMGCSQGMIYRYYKGVDEIYLDLMNREIAEIDIRNQISCCLQEDIAENEMLRKLFNLLGEYIVSVQQKIGGKFYYELLVTYAFDEKKQKELLPQLLLKQNLMFIQSQIVDYIMEKVETGRLALQLPIEQLAIYVGDTIDGISNHGALIGKDDVASIRPQMMQLYEMVGEYVITKVNSNGKENVDE